MMLTREIKRTVSELLIDELSDITNWTNDSGLTIALQGWEDYIANDHDYSIGITIPEGSSGLTAMLTLPSSIDISEYSELVFNITSLRLNSGDIRTDDDALYSISILSGQDFSIPCYRDSMTAISIPIDGFTTVDRLKLIINHDYADYIVLSDFRAVKEDFPSDILDSVKTSIETERDRIGALKEIGTITGSAGDESVTIATDWEYIENNVVIEVSGEKHQLKNVVGNEASFYSTYDGPSLVSDLSEATTDVTIPVEIGYYDREANLPGIVLWYSSPTPQPRNSRAEYHSCVVGPLGIYRKRDGLINSWQIQIEVAARSPELENLAAQAVRSFLTKSIVWVHGRRLWFEWKDPAIDNEPVDAYDIVPRASYNIDIELREDTWQIIRTVPGSSTLTVTPVTQ